MGLSITVIFRPGRPGSGAEGLRSAVTGLRRAGHVVAFHPSRWPGEAVGVAQRAARAREDLVIAAGGDGTINEVVNGLARSRWRPRLGIVPLGTANDFAAGLALPADPGEAVAVAVHGRPVSMDLARVNQRYFLNVSTGGIGAAAARGASREAKRLLGPLAYLITGVRAFVELRPARARFVADGRQAFAGEFLLFAVGNGGRTGGGSWVTPLAAPDDGLLDLMIVRRLARVEFLALLPELRAGTHLSHPAVVYTRAREIRIRSREPLSVNADGEPLRAHRFAYRVAPRPISIMVP